MQVVADKDAGSESISHKSGLSLPEVLSASDILVHFSGFRSLTRQFSNLDDHILRVAPGFREKEPPFRRSLQEPSARCMRIKA